VSSVPKVTRVRHETRRRQLQIKRLEPLAPKMLRVVFTGDELYGFTSLGFDDHVKLFFPQSATETVMRDFTPRHFNEQARELWIDFYLHEAGPATTWAASAQVGQSLSVGGPRGSSILSVEGIDVHVLIADETGVPAIGRRLEELPPHARAMVVIESDGGVNGYPLESAASLDRMEVRRGQLTGSPGTELIEALRQLQFAPGKPYFWVATETHAARAIRRYLTTERGIDRSWIKAAGYWQRGTVGAHHVVHDD
jgi:NADPH-dependent ferric siderophore reductase